jgi:hypothetical protein
MPNRILRDGILTSDKVNSLSFAGEIFYRRLMSIADDYGLCDGRIPILRAQLYALKINSVSEKDVKSWRNEAVNSGLINAYVVDGKEYIQIQNFGQQTRSKPKHPLPTDGKLISIDSNCNQLPAIAHLDGDGDGDEGGCEYSSEFQNETSKREEGEVMVFICSGSPPKWSLPKTKLDEWQEAFPGVDVLGECRKALQWTRDNPSKKKTARGMPKFLFGWLERCQNRGGSRLNQPKQEIHYAH